MTYLSIIEKFKVLFNAFLDFKFVLVFTILLLIFTLLYSIKKLSTKKYVLCMTLLFTILFSISIIGNYKILYNTFDNFTTIFFGNIYFPSIYVYVGVLVVSFISFIVSMLNPMIKKIYKVINSIMFIVNNILFVIVINIIAKNKIDIFSINSLYTDTTLVVILELSIGLFILWVLSLTIVYITNCVCERIVGNKTYDDEIKDSILFNTIPEINNELTGNTSIVEDTDDASREKVSINSFETVIKENNVVEKNDNIKENNVFDDILNGTIPVTYYDNNVKEEEYKLVNPQMVYEDKYNKIKNDIIMFNDIEVSLDKDINDEDVIFEDIEVNSGHDIRKDEVIFNNIDNVNNNIEEEMQLSVEEKTLNEKTKVSKERLLINTISLNDLIDDEENNTNTLETLVPKQNSLEVEDNNRYKNYTIDDYKKIAKMLKTLKKHSNSTNIKIDDAVAISLISNYSIDDCMKFKNILESNLN